MNPNPTFTGSAFGSVLAASGLRAAIGAPLDDSGGSDAGGVYLFNLDPGSVGFGALLKTVRSPNASPNFGKFGSSLSFAGTRLAVGAESDGSTATSFLGSGAAYLIDGDPGSAAFGSSLFTFKKTAPAASDKFGSAVALNGDDVLIGAPLDGTSDTGAVYRFGASAFHAVSSTSVNEGGSITVSGSFAARPNCSTQSSTPGAGGCRSSATRASAK